MSRRVLGPSTCNNEKWKESGSSPGFVSCATEGKRNRSLNKRVDVNEIPWRFDAIPEREYAANPLSELFSSALSWALVRADVFGFAGHEIETPKVAKAYRARGDIGAHIGPVVYSRGTRQQVKSAGWHSGRVISRVI